MHQTQGNTSSSTNGTQRHTRRPLARPCSRLFHHNNSEYLLIVDIFCKYPFLYKVSSKAAEPITLKFRSFISQYGLPKRLSTDNGPPFSSGAFAKFMQQEHIKHITSSPHYLKSNTFIERQIKTIKTALFNRSRFQTTN